MSAITEFARSFLTYAGVLFVFLIGVFVLYLAVLYIIDRTQKEHTVRRNYPRLDR